MLSYRYIRLGRYEVQLEAYAAGSRHLSRWFSVTRRNPGELFIDAGRYSLILTDLRRVEAHFAAQRAA